MKDTVIKFDKVSKIYKLYSSTRKRLLGIFLKNIKYKTKKAVDEVSFEIKRGDSVALFGKNDQRIVIFSFSAGYFADLNVAVLMKCLYLT